MTLWEVSSPCMDLTFRNFKTLLKGFCSPKQPSKQIKNQKSKIGDDAATVCSEQSSHIDEHNVLGLKSSCIDLSNLFDPVADLLCCCSRSTIIETQEEESCDALHCNSRRRTATSAEAEVLDSLLENNDASSKTDSDDDDELIIETIPGNHRLVRAYKAVEMCSSAIVLVITAIYVIMRLDTSAEICMMSRAAI